MARTSASLRGASGETLRRRTALGNAYQGNDQVHVVRAKILIAVANGKSCTVSVYCRTFLIQGKTVKILQKIFFG